MAEISRSFMPRMIRVLMVTLLFMVALAPAAFADIMYSYTGQNFTLCDNVGGVGGGSCTGALVTNVSGSFNVTTAFAANLTLVDETANLTSYSFTDGRDTWTQLNSSVQAFTFSTDSLGNISQWFVNFGTDFGQPDNKTINTNSAPDDFTEGPGCVPAGCPDGGTFYIATVRAAGTWQNPTAPTVPEPTSLVLLASVLGGLAILQRRKVV